MSYQNSDNDARETAVSLASHIIANCLFDYKISVYEMDGKFKTHGIWNILNDYDRMYLLAHNDEGTEWLKEQVQESLNAVDNKWCHQSYFYFKMVGLERWKMGRDFGKGFYVTKGKMPSYSMDTSVSREHNERKRFIYSLEFDLDELKNKLKVKELLSLLKSGGTGYCCRFGLARDES